MSTRFRKLVPISLIVGVIVAVLPAAIARAQPEPGGDVRCSPAAEPVEQGTHERMLTSGGRARRYLVYIPLDYDPAVRLPVVMSLHGFTSSAQAQRTISQWDVLADSNTFIAVYPQGLATFPFPARWNNGKSPFVPNDSVDDVAYIRELLADLAAFACVDPARVYATGYSAGAGMVNRLACELSDQITAIGGVAGAYVELDDGCNPVRPVPVMLFHGSADPIASINGAPRMFLIPPSDLAAAWAERNGCNLMSEALLDQGEVSGIRFTGCEAGAEVVFYTIEGGGHTWPGGGYVGPEEVVGRTTTDIVASGVMWDFFRGFALPLD